MKQTTLAAVLILLSAAGILVLNSAYIVDETEQVVITQFGEPVGDPLQQPGLHWRIPFIQVVNTFDKRILNWDGYPSEVPTRDKKFIWVDITGRWRIVDPLLFLQTMHNERNAQTRLDDIMDGITRNFITRYHVAEVVRTTNRIFDLPVDADDVDVIGSGDFEKIQVGRNEITRQILESARLVVKDYGIELVDLRIKRISYIESVLRRVYERMIAERNRAAEQLRSEGQGVRAEVEGQRDKELQRIASEAHREAQKIRGQADAESTRIYGEAYSKDPDFYSFLRTLESYPSTLRHSRVILSTDNEFLRYLRQTTD